MEKYSASYANIKNNFVFQNIDAEEFINEYYGLFCVLKNLIQRGNPTRPSQFLLEKLGELSYVKTDQIRLIDTGVPKWYSTIKGNDEDNDYPALTFFEELIPIYLKEFSFIQQLLKPETLISDIVEDKNKVFVGEQVDFYLPQAKLVIEIDGIQHQDKVNILKDNSRDNYLKKNGITIIRINSKSIKQLDNDLDAKFQEINKVLQSSEELAQYKQTLQHESKVEHNIRVQYDAVLRFQLLILTLLQKGKLTLQAELWNIDLVSEESNVKNLFSLAAEDVFIWMEHLCKLKKIFFRRPVLNFVEKECIEDKVIQINFSMMKRWTDENILDPNVIFVRNDYFDEKDYFQLSTTDSINYDVRIEDGSSDIDSLIFLLKNIFAYDSFNDGQLPIIVNSINRIDTIGILPTGSGKSLCYQIACLLQPCISFVVCPILSLIYDQKQNLDDFQISRTNIITSDKNALEKDQIISEFALGRYQLIWISPERFQSQPFRDSLSKINYEKNFAYAVIDEVHCLSEWGHDFRTSYLTLIKTIKNLCPEAILLGLTATASQFVLEDLKNEFGVDSSHVKSVSSMNRDELDFHLIKVNEYEKESKYKQLLQLLGNINKKYKNELFIPKGEDSTCGIIFTINKTGINGCVNLARKLSSEINQEIKSYHGGLGAEKYVIQDKFKDNEFTLLAATKSFGMGVNKKNIRYTIHYGLPWSIEAFYQEAGRAGRGSDKSQKSDCYILYQPEKCDKKIIDNIFSQNVSIAELHKLELELKSDLQSILFLWLSNNDEIENELDVMRWIMNTLFSQKTGILQCTSKYKKDKVEKGLYKLSLLGFINDWTIEKWGTDNAILNVDQNEYNEFSVKTNLVKYITRYDASFSISDQTGRYKKYLDILTDTTIKSEYTKCMKVLLMWSYDNIIYHRRKTIQNMMNLCENFTDGEAFRTYINNYFRFSDSTIHLDNIINKPEVSENWFELFYKSELDTQGNNRKKMITVNEAKNIIPAIDRYLESYRYNTGLNYVNALIRLFCNDGLEDDAKESFEDSLNAIENVQPEKFEFIIDESLKLIKHCDEKSKDLFSEIILRKKSMLAKKFYKELGDNTSLKIILNDSLHKLRAIEESMKW